MLAYVPCRLPLTTGARPSCYLTPCAVRPRSLVGACSLRHAPTTQLEGCSARRLGTRPQRVGKKRGAVGLSFGGFLALANEPSAGGTGMTAPGRLKELPHCITRSTERTYSIHALKLSLPRWCSLRYYNKTTCTDNKTLCTTFSTKHMYR